MTSLDRPHSRRMDVAGRARPAARRARRARVSTRCSSPTSPTCATSPASPARPALLLVRADDAAVRHRRPLPRRRRPSSSAAAGVDGHASRSARPWPSSASVLGAAAARASTRLGLEAHARHAGPQQRDFADDWFAGAELVPDRRRWSRSCAGSRTRRGRPHPRPRARSPTTRSPRCCRRLADGPDRARVRARRSSSRCAGAARSGNSFEPIVAAGPERREAARPPDATGAIERGELVVHRLRLHRRRLLLRHDPHRVASATRSPTPRRMLRRRAESQRRGRDAVRAGRRRAPTVDRACRDVIADAGWADAFVARHRPRRRPRDPRGPAGGRDGR